MEKEVDGIISVEGIISGLRIRGEKDKTHTVVIPVQRVFNYIDKGYDFFATENNVQKSIVAGINPVTNERFLMAVPR
jgi:hypothetical protein